MTTRRIGVDQQTLALIQEVAKMQRAYPQAYDPQAELAKQRRLLTNRLALGEQREDLLSVAATFNEDGEVIGGALGATMMRRFPTPVTDEKIEFIGASDDVWAPELLKSTVLDQREDYSNLINEGGLSRESTITHRDEYRAVIANTLGSITFIERLLIGALLVHCSGLLVMTFMTIAVGNVMERCDGCPSVFESLGPPKDGTTESADPLAYFELEYNVTARESMRSQSVFISGCLIWAVLSSLLSTAVAILDENEELELALTWFVNLAILLADLSGHLARGATHATRRTCSAACSATAGSGVTWWRTTLTSTCHRPSRAQNSTR